MNRRTLHYDGTTLIDTTYRDVDWKSLRVSRNQELENCDWRFMSDQSPSDEWTTYRVFLRELPQNYFDESDGDTQGCNTAADAWNEYDKPEGA